MKHLHVSAFENCDPDDVDFRPGDRARIIKNGTQYGRECTVKESEWHGRIKVRMRQTGDIKSYLPEELVKIQGTSTTQEDATSSTPLLQSRQISKISVASEFVQAQSQKSAPTMEEVTSSMPLLQPRKESKIAVAGEPQGAVQAH